MRSVCARVQNSHLIVMEKPDHTISVEIWIVCSFWLASWSRKGNTQRNQEECKSKKVEWRGMKWDEEKCKKSNKYAGVCSICHLSVTDFLTKTFHRLFYTIQQRKMEPLTLVSRGEKSKCKKQVPLEVFILNIFRWTTTRNPNWKFERECFSYKISI